MCVWSSNKAKSLYFNFVLLLIVEYVYNVISQLPEPGKWDYLGKRKSYTDGDKLMS